MNLGDLKEHVRKGQRHFELYSGAVAVVDEVIELQASIDDLNAEEKRIRAKVNKDKEESGALDKTLAYKRMSSNTLNVEIAKREKKVKELKEYMVSGFKNTEAELAAESKVRINLARDEEAKSIEKIKASTKVAKDVLDSKLAAIKTADKELDMTRKGILALLNN